MRVFLAGATAAIGRRLVPLLLADGHAVTGSTRKEDRAAGLTAQGATPAIVDFMDAAAARQAIVAARPEVVIHELTDLPQVRNPTEWPAALERNSRLRIVATGNLVRAAVEAGAGRVVAQSVAFAYAAGALPHRERDPINPASGGVLALERFVLETRGSSGSFCDMACSMAPARGATGRVIRLRYMSMRRLRRLPSQSREVRRVPTTSRTTTAPYLSTRRAPSWGSIRRSGWTERDAIWSA